MAYSNEQLTTLYNALNEKVLNLPSNSDIDDLTELLTNQHVAVIQLINALTARIQNLEDQVLALSTS